MGSTGHPRRAQILVLDDDREMGAWLVDLLTDEGYTVEAYQQGTDILAALEQGSPDLLITDLVLNGIKGMDVLRRANSTTPHWLSS